MISYNKVTDYIEDSPLEMRTKKNTNVLIVSGDGALAQRWAGIKPT